MKIAVVGGGIAGLAVANGLINRGHDITVYERAPALRAAGAGIGLWPTALRCLNRLGVADPTPFTHAVSSFEFRSATGHVLAAGDIPRWRTHMGADLRFIDRSELLELLASRIPQAVMRFGHSVASIEIENDHPRLVFEHGKSVDAELVIRCDGARSAATDGPPLRFSGATCWRGICEAPDHHHGRCGVLWGSGRRFGINPLTRNRIYWWATQLTEVGGIAQDPPRERDFLLNLFRCWDSIVTSIIEATPPGAIRRDDLFDSRTSNWGHGPVIAIGDAAHPILPTLGMAGVMAIEDAWTLVDEIDRGPDIVGRLSQRRSHRIDRLRALSIGASRVGHARGLAAMARDVCTRMLPDSFLFRSVLDLQCKDGPL